LGADSDVDSDFVDNDYEFDIDDDDLFAQNVDDMLINEEANTKGKDLCIQEELEEDNGEDVVGSTDLNLPQWEKNMEQLKKDSPEAFAWVEELTPDTWVKTFFSDFPKCDLLSNNNCEVFNK